MAKQVQYLIGILDLNMCNAFGRRVKNERFADIDRINYAVKLTPILYAIALTIPFAIVSDCCTISVRFSFDSTNDQFNSNNCNFETVSSFCHSNQNHVSFQYPLRLAFFYADLSIKSASSCVHHTKLISIC